MLASAQCRPASCQAAVREIRAAPIPPAALPWELLTHSYGGSTGRNIATAFLFSPPPPLFLFPLFSSFLIATAFSHQGYHSPSPLLRRGLKSH